MDESDEYCRPASLEDLKALVESLNKLERALEMFKEQSRE